MFNPTAEQIAVKEAVLSGRDVTVNAFAGCGKTSTMRILAEAMEEEGLAGTYIAFNKAIAVEAGTVMPTSVMCRTMHSIAYGATPKPLLKKLSYPKPQMVFYSNDLGFGDGVYFQANSKGIKKHVNSFSLLYMLNKTITNFCNSGDTEIGISHVGLSDYFQANYQNFDIRSVKEYIFSFAKKYWEKLIDPDTQYPITHDVYLKLFALSGKKISHAKYIMLDEAQDSSPVFLQILANQHVQKVYVGDRHQNIYAWRGSVNAMDMLKDSVDLYLTKTFRFGKNIGYLANRLLRQFGEKNELIDNGSDVGIITDSTDTKHYHKAIICRKNLTVLVTLLDLIKSGVKDVAVSCDKEDIISFIDAYTALLEGKKFEHKSLSIFDNAAELYDYIEENPDCLDVTYPCKLVEQFGAQKLKNILLSASSKDKAEYYITTAHKSKGLEWDQVTLINDFNMKPVFDEDEGVVKISSTEEEMRLLYVAMTRAKVDIDLKGFNKILRPLGIDISLFGAGSGEEKCQST